MSGLRGFWVQRFKGSEFNDLGFLKGLFSDLYREQGRVGQASAVPGRGVALCVDSDITKINDPGETASLPFHRDLRCLSIFSFQGCGRTEPQAKCCSDSKNQSFILYLML